MGIDQSPGKIAEKPHACAVAETSLLTAVFLYQKRVHLFDGPTILTYTAGVRFTE